MVNLHDASAPDNFASRIRRDGARGEIPRNRIRIGVDDIRRSLSVSINSVGVNITKLRSHNVALREFQIGSV